MTRHYPDVSSAADWLKHIFSQTDLGSDAQLGWSFGARFSDVISRGNQL